MTSLLEHLEAESRALPAAARSQAWRREALAQFALSGLPTKRDEPWHYTDLKPLADARYTFAVAEPDGAARREAGLLLETRALPLAGPRLVFVDGHLDPALSRFDAEPGVEIVSLAESWGVYAPTPSALSAHPLAALNAAFLQQGALIRIAHAEAAKTPIQLVFVATGPPNWAPQPRIAIELATGAGATVVQHFIDAADAPGWLNLVTEIEQKPGSKLSMYRLQEHGREQLHTSLLRARLQDDAFLSATYVDRGGRLVRNDVDVCLAAPGARVELSGLQLAAGTQHLDDHLRVEHAAPRTTSVEAFRAIADDSARSVFCGKVVVQPHAQQIDARQSSDNLLLSAKAEIDTKPELEIYADDVRCTHGATIGELDEEHLFYLRSRGVAADAARALLTFAFAYSILERIDLAPLRERAARAIAARLPEAIDWDELA